MVDGDGSKPKRLINDVDSDYYLHPADHTGLNVCSVVLKGDNFEEWAVDILNAFVARRKVGFLEGTVVRPTDPANLADWRAVNAMLLGWVFRSIDPALRSSISRPDTVFKLWTDLHDRFSVGNGPRILQLRADISKARQAGASVANYFGTIKKLWDDLAVYLPVRSCTCDGCKCKITEQLVKDREAEQVHQFLIGLDDSPFHTLRSTVIAHDPPLPLSRVYSLAIQEERHVSVVKDREIKPDALALAAHRPPSNSSGRPFCSNCNRPGHDVSKCYKIIGFPEGYGRSRGSSGSGRGQGRGAPSGSSSANSAQQDRASQQDRAAPGQSSILPQDRAALGSAVSQEQWNAIYQVFNSLNSKSQSPSADQPPGKPPPWIFDTGASFHMTGSRDLLRDLTSIAPISIKLPDDRLAVASHRGSVVLPNGAIIPRVSYVPNLDCNLLSSAQLTAESDCVVTLTSKFFVIQDLATRTVIGLGEVRDGVYWLRYLSSKAVGSARSSSARSSCRHDILEGPLATLMGSCRNENCLFCTIWKRGLEMDVVP